MKSSLLLAFEVVYKEAAVADDLPREAGSMGPLVAEGYKSDDPSSLGKTSGVDWSPRPLCLSPEISKKSVNLSKRV